MGAFEWLINLLVLMSALSIVSERLANVMKLRHPNLCEKKTGAREEKVRERRIARRVLVASLLLAFLLKADLFAMLSHSEAPWQTIGWVRGADDAWTVGRFLQTTIGTLLTGMCLSFGSKFWHDVLDLVYGVRAAVGRA